ncbi:MAG: pyridoxamine 5'-phosphate oxidase [Phycisphaerales bacterium]
MAHVDSSRLPDDLHQIDFDAPPADPIPLFEAWMADARKTGLPNPNAMSLATVDPDGRPSCRIVLLKGFDARGAVFYTNRTSRKGAALVANPMATVVLHWDPLDRQVVIEGDIEHATDAESDAYFESRRRESRVGAWASKQSQPCRDRAELEAAVDAMDARFGEDGPVPRPPHWGGYRIRFRSILFWQGHPARLHDRIIYRPDGAGGWAIQRLYP